jgi:hypothetical protein
VRAHASVVFFSPPPPQERLFAGSAPTYVISDNEGTEVCSCNLAAPNIFF